jgi:hypothetical protein
MGFKTRDPLVTATGAPRSPFLWISGVAGREPAERSAARLLAARSLLRSLGLRWRLLVGLQRRLIYFPFPAQVPPAQAVVAGAREVTLRTVDGLALGVWLVEASEPDRGVAVLVAMTNPWPAAI